MEITNAVEGSLLLTVGESGFTKLYAAGGLTINNAPSAPTTLVLTEVNDSVTIDFAQSSSSDIDEYQVWSSVGTNDNFGLIGIIPKEDITTSMSITDETYTKTGVTVYYRVYALKNGIRSTALTGSKAITWTVADVSGLTVDEFTDWYAVQYRKPVHRMLDYIEIKMDKQSNDLNLDEVNGTSIYQGNAEMYIYKILLADEALYHQFWVYSVTRT